ncbi:MAG: hypothetical protein ACRD2K_04755 [Terriglobales bacterium]
MKSPALWKLLLPLFLLLAIPASPARNPRKPKALPPSPSIAIIVDVSEAPRHILHARLIIPASPGEMTLYYSKWVPGEHGPTGPIAELAGVKFAFKPHASTGP